MASKGEAPVVKVHAGLVGVAVFENENTNKEGKKFTTLSFVPQRSYPTDKEKSGFGTTNSLRMQDVLVMQRLLGKAYDQALEYLQKQKRDNDE